MSLILGFAGAFVCVSFLIVVLCIGGREREPDEPPSLHRQPEDE